MAGQPLGGLDRLIFRRFTITHFRHTTLGRTALDEWSARRRDLYLTTHNTHNTNIHASGGISFPLIHFVLLNFFFLHVTYVSYYRPYNKHNTNIHALGGTRTHNPLKRTAADPRLRPQGHWDLLICFWTLEGFRNWLIIPVIPKTVLMYT
jgi:hypothetical protein